MKISSVAFGEKVKNAQFFTAKKSNKYRLQDDGHEDVFLNSKKSKFKRALPYILIPISAGIGALAASLVLSKRNNDSTKAIEKIQNDVQKALQEVQKEAPKVPKDNKIWLALLALAGVSGYGTGKLTSDDKDRIIEQASKGQTPLQASAYGASSQVGKLNNFQTNPLINKYSSDFYGLSLLNQTNAINRNAQKYQKAIETIENIGYEKLTSTSPLAPIVDKEGKPKKNPVLWSVTSEFAPIKEGGLGSVPVEVRNNMEKLNISVPTFMPMYLNNGSASLTETNEKIIYNYQGKNFELEKLASFKMDVFKNGKTSAIPVEFYLYEDYDKDNTTKRQLVFIKCDKYFDGTIYEANSKTEEPEKFAVMSKAVYEFLKLKTDGVSANKDVKILNPYAFYKIKKPDGMILNDWQASPIAALARYKAVMENAYGQLSDTACEEIKNMRIITLGHNVAYQGSTLYNNDEAQRKASTSNILNTLFDTYTYDIVSHAKTGTERIDSYDRGLDNLSNVLVMNQYNPFENHTNLLNMGIILSDYFHPVSQNYANELISLDHSDLSNSLQWALVQKAKANKLVGIINGNDYKNLTVEGTAKRVDKTAKLTLQPYSKDSSKDTILNKRLENKKYVYREYILPFSESIYSSEEGLERINSLESKPEFVKGLKGTTLPNLSDEEIKNTPILLSGGRLVSQKGVWVLCDAIKMLFDNWDKDFPNKPKPIICIAGSDGEGGSQRQMIEALKNEKLSKEDNDRVLFAHGMAPLPALMASSDFFMMPSLFEPCGLTQGESFALGTPVIASAVGGIVDTVNRDNRENGILTEKGKKLDGAEFYNAVKKALNIYFNDKERYNNMVMDAATEDFSWIQHGKKGPVYDYLDIIGIKRENLKDV